MSTLAVGTIKSVSSAPPAFQNTSGTEIGTLCRVWINFDGTATGGSIRDDFNVSTLVDQGTGDYEINFTNALPNSNYAAVATGFNTQASDGSWIATSCGTSAWASNSDISTSRLTVVSFNAGGSFQDNGAICVAIFL